MTQSKVKKRRTVSFAASPPPPPRPRITPLQRIEIQSGSWVDVPLSADPDSTETTTLSPVPIPTNIHLDLQRASIIADPHEGTNERDVQWVHERTWKFSTEFFLTLPSLSGRRAELVFEGLDTFATVFLNGKEILKSENMFLQHWIDITDDIALMGKVNVITIEFESAMKRGDALLEEHGKRVVWNGHYSRPYVRKAQYHYGWDWGPSLVTCGPWKPIYVEIYSARLAEITAVPTLSPDLRTASLCLSAKPEWAATAPENSKITVIVASPTGKTHTTTLMSSEGDFYADTISISEPELWYPRSHGAQSMYTIIYTLTSGFSVLHTVAKKLGIRRVELVRDEVPEVSGDNLSGGTTFYFRINNLPIFCGGSNWIPADSFQPRITREKLKAILSLMSRGNQNMIRVWGGGIYESEQFYEICNEEGILVWQDICMACADYPAHLDYFTSSILKEVEQNLARLRWHPSLVLVAGNNEDYQVADEEVGYDKDAPEDTWRQEPFPSRWLYEKEFPEIVRRVFNNNNVDGGSRVAYWPGSPFGGEDSTDRTVGDIHQWNIWGGIQAPYQRYSDLGGRFVSEFGMPSFPSFSTMGSLLGPSATPWDHHPQSEVVAHHIKAHSFEKRLYPYILENFRISTGTMEEITYLSQLLQSEALSCAYRGWRQKWGKRHCGGALVWQLNDVWPAISWSITSFPGNPKPAFYAIARELRPFTIIARRHTNDPKPNSKVEALCANKTSKAAKSASMHSTPHIYPPKKSTVDISISSVSPLPQTGLRIVVKYITLASSASTIAFSAVDVAIEPNETLSLFSADVPEHQPTVVHSVLYDAHGEILSTGTDWPQPLKWVQMPEPGLTVEWNVEEVVVNSERCVKGLVFEEREGEMWADNGIDVVSGMACRIRVEGLTRKPGEERQMWWYGKW